MRAFEECNEQFQKNLKNISLYIDELRNKKKLYKFLESENKLKEFKLLEDKETQKIEYNAVIISLYGNFENFIDNILKEYLFEISKKINEYEKLPEKLRKKNEFKTGEFISNPQRYKNFGLKNNEVIKNLYKCLNYDIKKGDKNYILNNKLIISHGGNLRGEEIMSLMNEIGMEGHRLEIQKNEELIEHIEITQGNDIENIEDLKLRYSNKIEDLKPRYINNKKEIFKYLDELVEKRNQVAHGWVEDRLSYEYIDSRMVKYLEKLGSIITDIINKNFYLFLRQNDKMKKFDSPIEVYKNSILCINSLDSRLKKGGYIFSENNDKKSEFKIHKIKKIEIKGKECSEVSKENIDIGIEITGKIKKEWNYFYL